MMNILKKTYKNSSDWYEKISDTRQLILRVAVLIFLVLTHIPLLTELTAASSTFDSTWQKYLGWVWIQNAQYGTDVVFTYGPFGWMARNIFWLYQIPLMLGIAAAFVFVFQDVIRKKMTLFQMICFAVFAFFAQTCEFHLLLSMLLPFTLIKHFSGPNSIRREIFTTVAGIFIGTILFFIKFMYFPMILMTVLLLDLCNVLRKRFPFVLITFCCFCIGLWLIAGQKLSNFFLYIRYSFAISSGYSPAMHCNDGALTVEMFVFVYLCILMLFFLCQFFKKCKFLLPVLLFIMFMTLKHCFVRYDFLHMEMLMFLSILPLYLIAAGICDPYFGRFSVIYPMFAGILLMFFSYFGFLFYFTHLGMPALRIGKLFYQVLDYSGWRNNLEEIKKFRTEEYHRRPSADCYNYNCATGISHPLFRYRPRPVPQSYTAYSKQLISLNYNYLLKHPCDYLIWDCRDVDNRLFSMSDARSWPLFLANYEMVSTKNGEGYILLKKKNGDFSHLPLTKVSEKEVHFSEEVILPDSSDKRFVWCSFQIKKTFLGKLLDLFLYPPMLKVTMNVDQEKEKIARRIIPAMIEDPVLISPMVDTNQDFAGLFQDGGKSGKRFPKTITVEFQFSKQILFLLKKMPFLKKKVVGFYSMAYQPVFLMELFTSVSPGVYAKQMNSPKGIQLKKVLIDE